MACLTGPRNSVAYAFALLRCASFTYGKCVEVPEVFQWIVLRLRLE
jgi:hypothetical protein